jgi:hypothetical protein
MYPRVEIVQPDGHKQPTVLVQRREDEETFAMTVQQAHALMEQEFKTTPAESCRPTSGGQQCLACAVYDALEGIR